MGSLHILIYQIQYWKHFFSGNNFWEIVLLLKKMSKDQCKGIKVSLKILKKGILKAG